MFHESELLRVHGNMITGITSLLLLMLANAWFVPEVCHLIIALSEAPGEGMRAAHKKF